MHNLFSNDMYYKQCLFIIILRVTQVLTPLKNINAGAHEFFFITVQNHSLQTSVIHNDQANTPSPRFSQNIHNVLTYIASCTDQSFQYVLHLSTNSIYEVDYMIRNKPRTF